jgi:hypothetical protein
MGILRSRSTARASIVLVAMGTWFGITAAIGAGSAYAASASNLLKNGAFEGSGSGSVTGWSASNAALSLASDGVGGGYAGRAAASAAGTYKLTASTKPVKNAPQGEPFRASGMVRSDAPGKSVCLKIQETDSSGAWVASAQQCVTASAGWAAFPNVDVTMLGSGDSLDFIVQQASGVVGDSFEVDNLSIADLDLTAPTTPTGLSAVASSYSEIDLSWQPSSDPDYAGVAGYAIYRNGATTALATVAGSSTSYRDTTVSAGTTYSYTVAAFDYAQNYSSTSTATSATTPTSTTTTVRSDLWHMDETTGTTMADSTGNHPGTLHDVALGRPGDPAFPGTAYGFNGTSSYVVVPHADDLNAYNAEVHIALSLKTSTVPAVPDYDLFRKGEYPGQEYKIELQPNGQISCTFRGSAANYTIQAGPDVHDGVWHRIACVKLASSTSLTIDGVTWTKNVTIGSISNTYDMVIGAYPGGDWYEGALDEVSFRIG